MTTQALIFGAPEIHPKEDDQIWPKRPRREKNLRALIFKANRRQAQEAIE